jgi:acyl-coenzyme A thioesterase PaaI-like protein
VIPRTHLAIDRRLCGEALRVGEVGEEGVARVALVATGEMAVDERGLVHGGFVFGLADHAAMLAVNDPFVVLGSAEVRFLRPVVVGERLVAEARVGEAAGRKSRVAVEVRRAAGDDGGDGEVVMRGEFLCLTLDRHVLQGVGA